MPAQPGRRSAAASSAQGERKQLNDARVDLTTRLGETFRCAAEQQPSTREVANLAGVSHQYVSKLLATQG
jgi:hypothetical protein